MITFADCIPVALIVPDQNIVFSIHSGWRSTFLDITGDIIEFLIGEYSLKPDDFYIITGPAIKGKFFEVKEDIFFSDQFKIFLEKVLKSDQFKIIMKYKYFLFKKDLENKNFEYIENLTGRIVKSFEFDFEDVLPFFFHQYVSFKQNGSLYFDYKKLLLDLLAGRGIKNIFNLDIDTYSDARFSSFRNDKENYIAQGLISFIDFMV
jgi:copper oxidase (laccase) domain-containing protein